MAVLLKNLYSIINGKGDAKDRERSFTFIEFIKEFGYDNSSSSFLTDYKAYLSAWANTAQESKNISDKEFVRRSLTDTLKSIVLTYSSYEEQDFLANINWNDPMHQKAIIPFFAEKIKSICNFYKNKRQETHLIINKNAFKGSRTSLEQIIYDKILDFYFENKNLKPQISHLQNNLTISIEEYVDIYSEYFDIPRHKKCTDESRAELLEANINNVNYEDYVQLSKVLSDSLFNGEVFLEELPLIAQVGLDLSQKCAGDVASLRDRLLNEATLNQVNLGDQIAFRRKLYEKYLGCDLYYIYCADQNSIYIDKLAEALNPSGNLLNCSSADTAVVESDKVKLLSNIGLFFKPDKNGILKINANDFSWEIDREKLEPDTFYVFPDPNKYGDIGNNKSSVYPLIFEYKLNEYIKNISSGWAKDDPLAYISATTWNTYYTKQDNDYVLDNNKEYTYSFTALANLGIISDYQVDMHGNEYALIKGYTNNEGVFEIPAKFKLPSVEFKEGEVDIGNISNIVPDATLLNGGYFRDPRFEEDLAFPYNVRLRLANDYQWSGVIPYENKITNPDALTFHVDGGKFTDKPRNKYIDHYSAKPTTRTRTAESIATSITKEANYKNLIFDNFNSMLTDVKIRLVNKSFDDIKDAEGVLYIKKVGQPASKNDFIADKVKKYSLINDILIVEKADNLIIYQQDLESNFTEIFNNDNVSEKLFKEGDIYNILYNEAEEMVYIAVMMPQKNKIGVFDIAYLKLHKFSLETKKMYANIVDTSSDDVSIYNPSLDGDYDNFDLVTVHTEFDSFIFSYNNEHDTYIVSYLLNDNANYPYLYEHRFRIYNRSRFYNTLKTTVYYNDDVNQRNIYNTDISTAMKPDLPVDSDDPDKLPFFILVNG